MPIHVGPYNKVTGGDVFAGNLHGDYFQYEQMAATRSGPKPSCAFGNGGLRLVQAEYTSARIVQAHGGLCS